MMEMLNAKQYLLRSTRFDLIFKYLYLLHAKPSNRFYTDLYLEHIRVFNNFFEENPSDGVEKRGKSVFIDVFNRLYANMKENGYATGYAPVPMGENGEISDGAHRITCAALLGLDVPVVYDGRNDKYDYKFFLQRGIDASLADYAALEYVRLNPDAYIVNIHACNSVDFDPKIESILNTYGKIYYKKSIKVNYNAYVNLKKLFYENESWIGNIGNKFYGAQEHARQSFGKYPLRTYVLISSDLDTVRIAKAEIRALLKKDNFSIHINDTHEEAIKVAETYFNNNSLRFLLKTPFTHGDCAFDQRIEEFKDRISKSGGIVEDYCIGGSAPLNVLGIRVSQDIDYLCGTTSVINDDDTFSSHDSELRYYPAEKQDIVYSPQYHGYYRGVKIISIPTLMRLKVARREVPKDIRDIFFIYLHAVRMKMRMLVSPVSFLKTSVYPILRTGKRLLRKLVKGR